MIISPRRWGKSSLVEKVANEIRKKRKDKKVVLIDLFSVDSEEVFLETFAREIIKASTDKWEEWINSAKDFFQNLIPKINFGVDPTLDFSLSFDWKELKKHNEEILNLPEVMAEKKEIELIICLDEFQNLAAFKDFTVFEKKLRAVWQRQKRVTYCLFGSKRHMMHDIFNNPSKPFYRFGDLMPLRKIETDSWIAFIIQSFDETNKKIEPNVAALIPKVMKNHSWYVQQLSHYTWNLTDDKAEKEHVLKALTELINANKPFYQKETESLSKTQRNFLKAVSYGETRMTSSEVMQKYKLGTPRNVSKNKAILIKNDIIDLSDGNYSFLDPAFEIWFNEQFFNQSLEKQLWIAE